MENKIRRTYGYTNTNLILIVLIVLGLNILTACLSITEEGGYGLFLWVHLFFGCLMSAIFVEFRKELLSKEDKIIPEALLLGSVLAFPLSVILPYVWTKVDKIKDLINRL